MIGPKGKVINTIQQETGADISVSDDGMVGMVSIGSKDGAAVEEARRRIELILDPPTAEVGADYKGRVVNITKFGAFVNILPGRDGLIHISKLGRGKRIDRVEDVLTLGDELSVRVDDIDNGKLSLSLVGDEPDGGGDGGVRLGERPRPSGRALASGDRARRAPRDRNGGSAAAQRRRRGRVVRAFWDGEATRASSATSVRPRPAGRSGGDRGGERRGGGGRRPAAGVGGSPTLADARSSRDRDGVDDRRR